MMPGRKYQAGAGFKYRYGFNGKEDDKDISEGGQDYGMRIYDARLGRFLSVDPLAKEYPWNSTYAFAENDPINFIDLDGLEKAKKQALTMPVYQKVDKANVTRLVLVNTAHTEYRRTAKTWSIGAREYGYIGTYEDLTLTMYDADGDPSGNATIGYGYLIHHGKIGNTEANKLLEEPFKNGITESKAVDLLIGNIQEKEGYVNNYISVAGMENDITGQQYTALVDIALNMGQSNAKKIVKILKEEGAAAAAEKIRTWKPKKGGLGNRREFEALLIENKGLTSKTEMEQQNSQKRKEAAAAKKVEKKEKTPKKKK